MHYPMHHNKHKFFCLPVKMIPFQQRWSHRYYYHISTHAGPQWSAPFLALWFLFSWSIRSTSRKRRSNWQWCISTVTPVIRLQSLPYIFKFRLVSAAAEAPAKEACHFFDFFALVPCSCWKTVCAIAANGSSFSCRPEKLLSFPSVWTAYIMSRRAFHLTAAAPTDPRIFSMSEKLPKVRVNSENSNWKCWLWKRSKMARKIWIMIPWSTWCKESQMYIWEMQNVETIQRTNSNRALFFLIIPGLFLETLVFSWTWIAHISSADAFVWYRRRDWLLACANNLSAYFSVGSRPPARILGLASTEDCNC
jgi:hypothetical protein